MQQATVNLYFDKRRDNNTIKLCVTFKRTQRYFTTGCKVDPSTWERLKKNVDKAAPDGKIKDEDFLELWTKLWNDPAKFREGVAEGYVIYARRITKRLGANFDFDVFREAFEKFGKVEVHPAHTDPNNVMKKLQEKAAILTSDKRLGSAASYKDAGISLARFIDSFDDDQRKEFLDIPKPSRRNAVKSDVVLRFEHITPQFLKVYEQWMLNYGRAPKKVNLKKGELPATASPATLTTVGIYCRQLRSVFNDVISHKLVSPDCYPFGKHGYTIPAGSNLKKALSKDDVLKIIGFQCEPNSFQQRGRDLWVFSYLSNGMNITDICSIKWKDIDRKENSLTFIRQKTARTRKGNQSRIRVTLRPESWEVINRYATDNKPDSFVFPFLNASMTEQQKKITVSQVIKMTNQHMRAIAKLLEIDTDVSTYAARHSFATILLQSEAPIAFISQSLGHQNISTTQAYLGSFDDEKTRMYLNALL
ncbi:site-specific integrase [Dyadobacter sp. CY323]|uniref:tyrosine-type recombinase/integrase n=1 Tax=Dyadobacter sp. CY323 TaxID=2907302 RepID=UPI001F492ACA|nr:site-specific integrase [Dyadobacter sp. CY323]MCE6988156.1 site-specific integrase [Dyadobacter sp. CY323]